MKQYIDMSYNPEKKKQIKADRKRFLRGSKIIMLAIASAILSTFAYDALVRFYGHETRFQVIFFIGGGVMAIASIVYATIEWLRK